MIMEELLHEDEIPVGRAKDLRGQVFGRLSVLYRYNKKDSKGNSFWKCKCECGSYVVVPGYCLKNGNTRSCGCLQKENASAANIYDLTGLVFGQLTVIERLEEKSINGSYFYKCQCKCGNFSKVNTDALTSGHTTSCGCSKSKGELTIIRLLENAQIPYITQKTFENCYFTNGNSLKFDFYINNLYLIEFDGIQHFKPVEHFGGKEQFLIQTQRDQYKNQWCKENNSPLIRIPYTKLDALCIEDLLLETTQFRVV